MWRPPAPASCSSSAAGPASTTPKPGACSTISSPTPRNCRCRSQSRRHESAPLDCSDEAQVESAVARIAAQDLVREPSWSITSVTAEAHHIARMIQAADASADDPTKVVGSDTPAHRADAGMAWGTLIHGLLEHAMRQQDATAADLRRLGMWLTVEEPELRAVLDLAVTTVLQVAKAGFWTDAKKSEHSVETPFAFAAES